jgi:hypothetical protein
MRKAGIFSIIVGVVAGLFVAAGPAGAWDGGGFHPHARFGPRWGSAPFSLFSASLPVPGYRLYYPPGLQLSYQDPSSGATYCFSPGTGFYFVCGYGGPSLEYADRGMPPALGGPPPAGFEMPPQPSGVLLFRLPQDAEAAVDGEPVGLSGGVGAASVAPGPHRVLIRTAGQASERNISVASRSILTITPAGVSPTDR